MNAPNPSLAPGTFLEPVSKPGHSRIKVVIISVLGIHAAVLFGVLVHGYTQASEHPTPSVLAAATGPGNRAPAVPIAQRAPAPVLSLASKDPARPAAEPMGEPAGQFHIVAEGDGFYKIAKAHGISLKALAKANPGVDSTKLKVGQRLRLPDPKTRKPSAS